MSLALQVRADEGGMKAFACSSSGIGSVITANIPRVFVWVFQKEQLPPSE
jgi:hypothetical protein